jgi:hypothetical protein
MLCSCNKGTVCQHALLNVKFLCFLEFDFFNFFIFLISLLCSDYCSVYFYKSTSLIHFVRNVVTGNKFGSKTRVLKLCDNFGGQCIITY